MPFRPLIGANEDMLFKLGHVLISVSWMAAEIVSNFANDAQLKAGCVMLKSQPYATSENCRSTPDPVAPPHGEVHSYRYELILRTGDFRFTGEIAPSQRSVGPRFDVETDNSGKITSVARYENGQDRA